MGYEIDRDALSKLRNLDDETMSNIIRKIAAASGTISRLNRYLKIQALSNASLRQ